MRNPGLRFSTFLIVAGIFVLGCQESEVPENQGLGLQEELDLGTILKQEMDTASGKYGERLRRADYQSLYDYLYAVQDSVLRSELILRESDIPFEPIILLDDNKYQAFSLPGGVHYYYTGLLKYLEDESQLAALMSKEISHNDRAEPFTRLELRYGQDIIVDVIQGGQSNLRQDMIDLILEIGYDSVTELSADHSSVDYLCGSSYLPAGLARVYDRAMQDSIQMDTIMALNPEGILRQYFTFYSLSNIRSDAIRSRVDSTTCTGDSLYSDRYQNFVDLLNAI